MMKDTYFISRAQMDELREKYGYDINPHGLSLIVGHKVEVVDDTDNLPEQTVVICLPTELMTAANNFPDNVHDKCFMCDRDIIHRPNIPQNKKKGCFTCWQEGKLEAN